MVSSAQAANGDSDGHPTGEWDEPAAVEWDEEAELAYRETVYDAMILALSGRIFLDETIDAAPEQVLREIWEDHFILDPAAATPG